MTTDHPPAGQRGAPSCPDVVGPRQAVGPRRVGDVCPVAVGIDPFLEAVVVIGAGGRIVVADQGVERLLGYPPEELLGRPVESLVPTVASVGDRVPRLGGRGTPGGPADGERIGVVVARDGREMAARIVVRSVAAADGARTAVVIRAAGGDQNWPECRQHLDLSQQAAGMGSWEQVLPDGPMRWSPQLFTLLGIEPGSVTPGREAFYSRVHPQDLPALAAQVDHAHAHGGRMYAEVRLIGAGRASTHLAVAAPDARPAAALDGDPLTGLVPGPQEAAAEAAMVVAVAGTVEPDPFGRLRTIGTVQDITGRWLLQQRLMAEDVLLRAAFDQAPLGMCLISLRPGRVGTLIKVNRALCELAGRPERELLGRNTNTLLIAEDEQEPQQLRERILRGQTTVLDGVERRIDRPDGTQVWVRLTSTVVGDRDGAPDYVFVHQIQDITDSRARRQVVEQRTRRDRRIAQVLQEDLLPRVPGWVGPVQVAARYQPAGSGEAVGGDWYDVFALPYDRIGIVVGDVAGHGVESAAAMTRLRYAVRMLATTGACPADVTARLNQMMHGLSPDDAVQMATVVHAQLDLSAGTLTYASAGHPPLLVMTGPGDRGRPDRPRIQPLPITGDPPLGAAADLVYLQHTVTLDPGSRLIGFTDGLIERRDQDLQDCMTGLVDRLAALPAHALADPEQLAEQILAAAPSGPRQDDTALLVLTIPAPPPSPPARTDRTAHDTPQDHAQPPAWTPDPIDPASLDPASLDPASLDPASLDPASLDLTACTQGYLQAAHRRLALRTEQERQIRRAMHLEVLAKCSRTAQASLVLARTDLEQILRHAAHVLGGCLLAFELHDQQTGRQQASLRAVANTDPVIEALQRDLYTTANRPPITHPHPMPGAGPIVQHVDAAQLIRRHGESWRSYARWLHGSTVVWIPIAAHGATLGLLGAQRRTPLEADELDFLTDLADRLALAEHHRRLTAERDQTARALEASQTRFQLAFDNAPIGMVLASLDPAHPGRYLMVNQAMCDLTGYSRQALIGMSFRDLTHPDDQAEDAVQAGELIAGTRHRYHREKRLIRADGATIWVRMSATPAQAADGTRYVVGHLEALARITDNETPAPEGLDGVR